MVRRGPKAEEANGTRTALPREPSHAARLPRIRRVLLLSGFTFVAWVLGAAAPAFADTSTLHRRHPAPETAVAQTTAELTELVDTALTTDRPAPLPSRKPSFRSTLPWPWTSTS